jgi:UDP-glucose 4-epimerase
MKCVIIGGASSVGVALKPILSAFSEVVTAGRTNCDVALDLTAPAEEMRLPDGVDVVVHTGPFRRQGSR